MLKRSKKPLKTSNVNSNTLDQYLTKRPKDSTISITSFTQKSFSKKPFNVETQNKITTNNNNNNNFNQSNNEKDFSNKFYRKKSKASLKNQNTVSPTSLQTVVSHFQKKADYWKQNDRTFQQNTIIYSDNEGVDDDIGEIVWNSPEDNNSLNNLPSIITPSISKKSLNSFDGILSKNKKLKKNHISMFGIPSSIILTPGSNNSHSIKQEEEDNKKHKRKRLSFTNSNEIYKETSSIDEILDNLTHVIENSNQINFNSIFSSIPDKCLYSTIYPQNNDLSYYFNKLKCNFIVLKIIEDFGYGIYSVMTFDYSKIDNNNNRNVYLKLQDNWCDSIFQPNSIIHIINFLYENANKDSLLIYNPIFTISPTTIASATSCERRAVLFDKYSTGGINNIQQIHGNIIHELFEIIISNVLSHNKLQFTQSYYYQLVEKIVNKYRIDLFSIDKNPPETITFINEYFSTFNDFLQKYILNSSIIDFGSGSYYKTSISKHIYSELNLCSLIYGLKGQIDAMIEINRVPTLTSSNSNNNITNESLYIPLELKTGKKTKIEHRAQVILYGLILFQQFWISNINNKSNENENTITQNPTQDTLGGILSYISQKENQIFGVPGKFIEISSLIKLRNNLVNYLLPSTDFSSINKSEILPSLCNNIDECTYCSCFNNCIFNELSNTYLSFQESSDNNDDFDINKLISLSSIPEKLYSRIKSSKSFLNLSKTSINFFLHWNNLISIEYFSSYSSSHLSIESIFSNTNKIKYEKKSINNLTLINKNHCDYNYHITNCKSKHNQYIYLFSMNNKYDLFENTINEGDTIVISGENGPLFISYGRVLSLLNNSISVSLNKPLLFLKPAIYRIDKIEPSASYLSMRSNILSLVIEDDDTINKHRELIFSMYKKTIDNNIISKNVHTPYINKLIQLFESYKITNAETNFSSNNFDSIFPTKISNILHEFINNLNIQQQECDHFHLVLGLPGTGKTTTIVLLIRILSILQKNILICAHTNSAVDNILLKLLEKNEDKFLRIGNLSKIHSKLHTNTFQHEHIEINIIKSINIFATTALNVSNNSIINACLHFKKIKFFDFCISDEASQINQPTQFGPILISSHFILIGDHYQLEPLVKNKDASKKGLNISLFKQLSDSFPNSQSSLTKQYRMNSDICFVCNKLVYKDKLECGDDIISNRSLLLPNINNLKKAFEKDFDDSYWLYHVIKPENKVMFLDTDLIPNSEEVHRCQNSGALKNPVEVNIIYQITLSLKLCGVDASSIGIISPYRYQKQELQNLFLKNNLLSSIEIDTIDRYQGRDKACILLTLVRSNKEKNIGKLLTEWQRINVAITRAKSKLIVVGSKSTISFNTTNNLLNSFLKIISLKSDWILQLPSNALTINKYFNK